MGTLHLRRQLSFVAACVFLLSASAIAEGPVRTKATSADRFMPAYTFTESLSRSQFAVIARLTDSTASDSAGQKGAMEGTFEISDVLKGESSILGATVDARMFHGVTHEKLFLLMGKRKKANAEISWRVSNSVTAAYREHVLTVNGFKETGFKRLAFFQTLLEHADQSVSANAHMEFVVASDDAFTIACGQLDRKKIRQWLAGPNISTDRRRLYLAMLARCGNADDAEWLDQQLTAKEAPKTLDATIGCYLALKGEAGLPFVQNRYLVASNATFVETYLAIRALRFVRDLPGKPLSKASIITSFRLLLENRAIADLVIADLVIADLIQLNDWESIDRLVVLFNEPDAEWCRVHIVNFVRACPAAIASERLKELELLAPEIVRRSKTFFPMPRASKESVKLRRLYGSKGC